MKSLKKQLTARNHDRRLFGLPVQQSPVALCLYEQLWREFGPKLNWIVELGSGSGALSLWFGMVGHLVKKPFLTVDHKPLPVNITDILTCGMMHVTATMDVWGDRFRDLFASYAKHGPGLLFCDNGDKPRELRTFAPLVAPGSLVLCHDYGDEILDEDIAAVDCVEVLQPWQAWATEAGANVAVLRRK